MTYKVGDPVKVRRKIEIVKDAEVGLWGEEAKIRLIDGFCFPVELEFIDPKVQAHYEGLGKRRFDFFELHKLSQ
ncbi:hypothetical protein [Paenibacillus medicaginis]|uniref:DUF2187 domain-containing protein n=1 Tax=Paenibacillus medicaginis TaxID=1470560 RepID=A0ABV5BXL5_9BACL